MDQPAYVLCVQHDGYEASLEPRKIYRSLPDPPAEEHGLIRVIDESGEDYLFPAALFVRIAVPKAESRGARRAAKVAKRPAGTAA